MNMAKVQSVTAADGRVIGTRASQTRQRLLDATERLLIERGVLNLTVVDVTRAAETSPATFYQYFTDVADAIKALSVQVGSVQAEILPYFEVSFAGSDGHEKALAAVEAFVEFWETHKAVLRTRDLRAEEGDDEFRRLRRKAFYQLMDPMVEQLVAGQKAKRVSKHLNPGATAAAMYAMLERLATYLPEYETGGIPRASIIDTMATVMRQTLTGEST
jgi:AcrR family transcriptional regulator